MPPLIADTAGRIMDYISDHPWPGCQWQLTEGITITWMSSAIASMLITAAVLVAVIVPVARRHRHLPSGSANFLEVLVVFVRDIIARPALHDRAYEFLPFLMTLFVYILGMNLMGIVPLEAVSHMAGLPMIGHTATCIPTVCAALACLTLLRIVLTGLETHARKRRVEAGWPVWLCWAISPLLWVRSLCPDVPGIVGRLLAIPLAALELVGAVAKCFSLMVRLCANMLSGHTMAAILMLFAFQVVRAWLETHSTSLFYVGPMVVLGAVAVDLLELLVAGLQAYIFTFLTAMFLGLYTAGEHQAAG